MKPPAILLLAVLLTGAAHAQSRAGDQGAWYLRQYGPAQPRDERERLLLEEAERVFARVAAVADRRLNRPPRLLVIQKRGVEAQALPDGTVVANFGLLHLCFGPSAHDLGGGRARLAFVLGHELAHLAHDDSWHAQAFAALSRHGAGQESVQERRAKELHADQSGFRYMLMAGHDPQAVLGPNADFLREWVAQAQEAEVEAQPDPRHPSFEQRSDVLRASLQAIAEGVPYFHFGVRLAQLGRPDDALLFLQRALEAFPGREVESNLGLVLYQRALATLAECGSREGLRFMLPVALDPETLAARLRLRDGSGEECAKLPAVRLDLADARQALESALRRDPAYLPARLNLAAVLLLQGDAREAWAKAGAPRTDGVPDDERLTLVEAVARYCLGRSLTGDVADGVLDTLSALETRCGAGAGACAGRGELAAAAAFDQARIQQERGREAAALEAWRRFLRLQPGGPWAAEARATLRRMGEPAGTGEPDSPAASRQPIEERLGTERRAVLKTLPTRPLALGELRGAVRASAGLEVLELRGTVELIEELLEPPLEAREVERQLGSPRTVQELHGAHSTWIYRDVAYDFEAGRAVRRVLFQGR